MSLHIGHRTLTSPSAHLARCTWLLSRRTLDPPTLDLGPSRHWTLYLSAMGLWVFQSLALGPFRHWASHICNIVPTTFLPLDFSTVPLDHRTFFYWTFDLGPYPVLDLLYLLSFAFCAGAPVCCGETPLHCSSVGSTVPLALILPSHLLRWLFFAFPWRSLLLLLLLLLFPCAAALLQLD